MTTERGRAELDAVGVERFTARDFHPGLVRHVVLFRLTDAADADEVTRRFHALSAAVRPDGAPVILSIESGRQSSIEDAGHGFELGFIVSFASEGDRNYYVGRPVVTDERWFDADHDAFKAFVGPLVDDVLVFDLAPS